MFSGGDTVELSELEFALHKHKLEGVETSVTPITLTGGGGTNSECCHLSPYVGKISGDKIIQGLSKTVTVNGSFFTPDTTVECAGLNIDRIEFINSHRIVLSVTANSTVGIYSMKINNGSETEVESAIEVLDIRYAIIDLRAGGTEFAPEAIEMRDGMSFTRTESGMYFTGADPWGGWARFVGDDNAWVWNRSEKKDISWIFTNRSSFMAGIGSTNTNPTSRTQYIEAEIVGYFSSSTGFYGFYGNRGTPGASTEGSYSAIFPDGSAVKKLVLENNGEPGSTYRLYVLPDSTKPSWTDNSNLVAEGTIGSNMTADEQLLMPFAVPRNGDSTMFLGFILEQYGQL